MGRISDHDMVVEIHTTLGFFKEKIIEGTTRLEVHEKMIEDYKLRIESRIKHIERLVWIALGGMALIASIVKWWF